MSCFQPLCICGSENTPCVVFQRARFYAQTATRVDTTGVAADIAGVEGENNTTHILPVYMYRAGQKLHILFEECSRRKLDPQSDTSHVCTPLCTYLTWRVVCFRNILLKLQKKKQKEKRENENALRCKSVR